MDSSLFGEFEWDWLANIGIPDGLLHSVSSAILLPYYSSFLLLEQAESVYLIIP